MKKNSYQFLFLILLISCYSKKETHTEFPEINSYIDSVINLPEKTWNSENQNTNEFQAELLISEIDSEKSAKLNGQWIVENGSIEILESFISRSNLILFIDSSRTTLSGWGRIPYTRLSKVYITKDSFLEYGYFVTVNDELVLTYYEEMNNDDLSFKEKPEAETQKLIIEWVNDNEIILEKENVIIKLKKALS